jgi:hypothetical protein
VAAGGPDFLSSSFGFRVERIVTNLLSTSNQNGAPSITANAVMSHPTSIRTMLIKTIQKSPLQASAFADPLGGHPAM